MMDTHAAVLFAPVLPAATGTYTLFTTSIYVTRELRQANLTGDLRAAAGVESEMTSAVKDKSGLIKIAERSGPTYQSNNMVNIKNCQTLSFRKFVLDVAEIWPALEMTSNEQSTL